jgi:AmmeMemoRadiSam system protein A
MVFVLVLLCAAAGFAVAAGPAVAEEGFSLTVREKACLLDLSRQTLGWYLKDGRVPAPDESRFSENLKTKKDCFVTLYKKGSGLRGCIGFGGPRPLYRSVINRTIAAATRDPRFRPVTHDELKDIRVEISVLTIPGEIQFDSPEDLLAKISPQVHGVILATRYGQSTFIPKVWEQLPDKTLFLSRLCVKHGAPPNTWADENDRIRVWLYRAVEFGETVYGRRVVGPGGGMVGAGGARITGAVEGLPEHFTNREGRLPAGTALPPGLILTPDSDVADRE